jgi:protoheme IX farnesyltransferase
MTQRSRLTGKRFRGLTVVTSIWILFLIFVGAVVRVTDSGMGCPDWPLCYNQIIPPAQLAAWIEFTHRVVAGIAALLTIAVAVVAWRNYRDQRFIYGPALGAVGIVFFQAFLGAITVWFNNHPLTVIAHLLAAMTYLALTLFLTTAAYLPAETMARPGVSNRRHRSFFRFLLFTGAALFFLLLSGAIVTGTGTGLACLDWPLCQGEIFPANAHLGTILHLSHRFIVVVVGAIIAAVVLQTRRHYAEHNLLVKWSTAMGLLFLVQIGVGGVNVLMRFPRLINATHLALAAAIWGSLIILTTIFYLTARSLLSEPEEDEVISSQSFSPRQKAGIYFKLTKPWIMILLLITTLTAMFIAAEGVPPTPLILYTLLGGALSAGGASVLNSYVDSDIDQVMSRTSRRATATGLITPQETLFLGLGLSTMSVLVFAMFVNTLSAVLSTLGILYYVFFYTLYLKRTTIHNIIIGGAAGAIPPLVGWTAVTGSLDLGAFYLFAIIFFWTPPHTWALALLVKKDYAQARVPMLPVVVGEKETTYQILLYSILLVTLTLLPFTFQMVSPLYLLAVLGLGLYFIYLAWKLWRNFSKPVSKRLYKFSQAYLALVFVIMAIDRSLF